MPEVLSESQIATYEQSGYLMLEDYLPEKVVTDIHDEVSRFEIESCSLTK